MTDVGRRYERDYRVRFDEAGSDGRLRASGFLRYAQDLAWMHSDAAGFDRPWYRSRGYQWLVRCVQLDLLRPIGYGATLRVTTQVIGGRRVWARRWTTFVESGDADVEEGAEASAAATALIDWVLLNAAGRPVRVPDEIVAFFSDGSTFEPAHVDLTVPAERGAHHRFRARASDIDPMDHVNNAAYLDYMDEALGAAGAVETTVLVPRSYAIEYLRPARPGDDLQATVWPEDTGWAYRLVGAKGSEIARARLKVRS
jgi:acyl-ACP thioesterase